MKLDTIVAGGSGVVYAGAAAFAAFGTNFLPPFAAIVGVKDGLIALLCFVWMVAEYRGGPVRARGIALAVALVFLVEVEVIVRCLPEFRTCPENYFQLCHQLPHPTQRKLSPFILRLLLKIMT
jgi:hypothetical protein